MVVAELLRSAEKALRTAQDRGDGQAVSRARAWFAKLENEADRLLQEAPTCAPVSPPSLR